MKKPFVDPLDMIKVGPGLGIDPTSSEEMGDNTSGEHEVNPQNAKKAWDDIVNTD